MKIIEILKNVNYNSFIGNNQTEIRNISIFDEHNIDTEILMWVNAKNLHKVSELNYGTVICESLDNIHPKNTVNYILSDKPRLLFNNVIALLFPPNLIKGIEKSAIIDTSVKVDVTAYIGHNVVVESGCIIGKMTVIGHNTVVKKDTIIGSNVIIGSNNVIGGIGFGYEKDLDGSYTQINHIGKVCIEDGVEIGNNTCIDRAVMGSTLLKKNCKIDNLVHIAHGATIGENSLIIANAMIAGSSIIGNNVWVAPSANVLNKISISNNTTIGMGAIVLKSIITEGDIVVGNPAKSIKK
jgi:UDP-3-O-[3-hydroxymyristoyl] glucosamine N-acyltransferase